MGLDISLKEKPEISFGYTHNVTPIWHKLDCYNALYMSDGKQVRDIVCDLGHAISCGPRLLPSLRKVNPPNGWGDADEALDWLWKVYKTFSEHLDCTIVVDK